MKRKLLTLAVAGVLFAGVAVVVVHTVSRLSKSRRAPIPPPPPARPAPTRGRTTRPVRVRKPLAVEAKTAQEKEALALIRKIEAGKAAERVKFSASLSEMSARCEALLPFLVECAEPDDSGALWAVVKAICWIGPTAAEEVTRLLRGPNWTRFAYICMGLGEMGRRGKYAIPVVIDILKNDRNVRRRSSAARVLGSIGSGSPEAAAALIVAVNDPEDSVHFIAALALGRMRSPDAKPLAALTALLKHKDRSRQEKGVLALELYGPMAWPAVDDLLEVIMAGPSPAESRAYKAIAKIGCAPQRIPVRLLPALVALLKFKYGAASKVAARILGRLGPEAKAALGDLTAALGSKDADVRFFAALALGRIGPPAQGAAPTLRKLVEVHAYNEIRQAAVWTLVRIGAHDEETVMVLIEAMGRGPTEVRAEAIAALGAIGDPAIAPLQTTLGHKNRYTADFAGQALAKMGPPGVRALGKSLHSEVPITPWRAGSRLSKLGPDARPALEDILRALQSESVGPAGKVCTTALARMGPQVHDRTIPALVAALRHSNRDIRKAATQALGMLGPAAKSAAEALKKRINDVHRADRGHVYVARARVLPEDTDATLDLLAIARIRGTRPDEARTILLERGGAAVEPLIQGLKEQSVDTRRNAVWFLKQVRPITRRVVSALLQALRDRDEGVRDEATAAVSAIGPHTKSAVGPLIGHLKTPRMKSAYRWRVIEVLGRIGPAAKDAVEELRRWQRDEDRAVREAATEALSRIERPAGTGVPAAPAPDRDVMHLVQTCADNKMGTEWFWKIVRKTKIVPPSAKTLEELTRVSEAPELRTRLHAALLWIRLGRTDEGIRRLAAAWPETNIYQQLPVAEALAELAPSGEPAKALLMGALTGGQRRTRQAAAEALGKMGPKAEQATGLLLKMLDSRERPEVCAAAEALGRIGAQPRTLVPALLKIMNTADFEPRQTAVRALGDFGPAAKIAVADLKYALDDPDGRVRRAAAEALKKIEGE